MSKETENEKVCNKAKEAVDDVFYDTSVSKAMAVLNLGELREQIDMHIDTLKDEIKLED